MKQPRQDIHNSEVPVLCQSCDARHRGICGALKANELIAFAQHTRVVALEAGDVLVEENGQIDCYANVMRGVVKLSKTLSDGRQQIVGLQFAPDFVGRLHVRESPTRAEASSRVELCRISRTALHRILTDNPALEARLLRQALRDVDEAREWMLALGRKTASEKVASFLLMIAGHIDPTVKVGDGHSFDLPLTRTEIGDFLGLTIGTVSRELTALRRSRIIEIESH
ncbi:Crp/Fnr family transcriptional regulator, partial [Salmonella enterica subsp. enterica serovar Enteritidis]|nr:Crp/Fnr family transcriptional regulator [Salmonella enterica subsp. enterica serovar Enteritidis]